MASKTKRAGLNRATCICVIAGLLTGAILRLYFSVARGNNFDIGQYLVELPGNVLRNVNDGVVTLAIKLVHFLISKCLQFKAASTVYPSSISGSTLFWVSLTSSVSAMPMAMESL